MNSSIDGCIQMKSFLAGNPELRLSLNEDLVIGKVLPRPPPFTTITAPTIVAR